MTSLSIDAQMLLGFAAGLALIAVSYAVQKWGKR